MSTASHHRPRIYLAVPVILLPALLLWFAAGIEAQATQVAVPGTVAVEAAGAPSAGTAPLWRPGCPRGEHHPSHHASLDSGLAGRTPLVPAVPVIESSLELRAPGSGAARISPEPQPQGKTPRYLLFQRLLIPFTPA